MQSHASLDNIDTEHKDILNTNQNESDTEDLYNKETESDDEKQMKNENTISDGKFTENEGEMDGLNNDEVKQWLEDVADFHNIMSYLWKKV